MSSCQFFNGFYAIYVNLCNCKKILENSDEYAGTVLNSCKESVINSSDVSLYLNLTVYILDARPYVSCGVDADMEGSGPVIFNQFELINKVSSS